MNVPSPSQEFDASEFGSKRGFLPEAAPLASLPSDAPPSFRRVDELATDLPEYLRRGDLRSSVRALDPPSAGAIDDCSHRELLRLYAVTGFLASAYVHRVGDENADSLPPGVAVPLYESASRLDRSPMLSYDAYVLHNWTLRDGSRGLSPDNLDTLLQFTSMRDERWFIAIHVAIENSAGPAVSAVTDLLPALHEDDRGVIERRLGEIESSLAEIVGHLDRMPEQNEPAVFNSTFRQYLRPFEGVTYEGVSELDGPQSYRGASGAQTALFAALDSLLGIDHDDNPLLNHVRDLRDDIPPKHAEFIDAIDARPDVRSYVSSLGDDDLTAAYNDCLTQLLRFRERHTEIVKTFLAGDLDEFEGTGGTPYGHYLDELRDTTENHLL